MSTLFLNRETNIFFVKNMQNFFGVFLHFYFRIDISADQDLAVHHPADPQYNEVCIYKKLKLLMTDLKRVYAAPTEEAALSELDSHEEKWS